MKGVITILSMLFLLMSSTSYAQDKKVPSRKLSCSVLIISMNIRQPIQNCEIIYEKDKRITTNCFSGFISVDFSNDGSFDNQKYKVIKKIKDSLEKVSAVSYIEDKESKILTNYQMTIDFLQKEFKGKSVGPFGYSDISGSCF